MDENSQEMYLQNLEEFVLDEDKIVTYKWLSKTLNIHVNQSKQLLYTFCSSKDKKASVSATYLLSGRLRSSGENCITVVGQDKYEDAKSAFETLSSEHVYSIQKTKQSPSGSTLFTADSQPVDGDCTASRGAIRCKDSVRRAAEELALLRVTVPPPAPTSVSKPVKTAPSTSKEPEKKSPVKAKPDEADKETKEAKPKGGLAAMFAAQTSKASTKPPSGATSSKNNAKGKKGAGISNFFSKVSKEEMEKNEKAEKAKVEKATAEKAKATKEDTSPAKVEEDEVMDVDSDEESKPSSPLVSAKKGKNKTDSDSKSKSKSSSKAAKQTKRSKTKEKKDEPKKRKRIVTQDLESSDEDIFEEEKNPSSREASPEPVLRAKPLESDEDEDIIPPTPVAESSNGRVRRKRKVTKDKTFMDENGYMVTEKVHEYESFSESDTENTDSKRSKGPSKPAEILEKDKESPPSASKGKKAKGKATAKKSSPVTSKSPLKNKQQSLMSFFKKKD